MSRHGHEVPCLVEQMNAERLRAIVGKHLHHRVSSCNLPITHGGDLLDADLCGKQNRTCPSRVLHRLSLSAGLHDGHPVESPIQVESHPPHQLGVGGGGLQLVEEPHELPCRCRQGILDDEIGADHRDQEPDHRHDDQQFDEGKSCFSRHLLNSSVVDRLHRRRAPFSGSFGPFGRSEAEWPRR